MDANQTLAGGSGQTAGNGQGAYKTTVAIVLAYAVAALARVSVMTRVTGSPAVMRTGSR